MDNYSGNDQEQQAGQPELDQSQAGQAPGTEQEYLTKAEATAMFADLMRRQKQSANDLIKDRVDKQISATLNKLQSAGITPTQQQTEQLKQQITAEEFAAIQSSETGQARPQQESQTYPLNDPVTKEALRIMDEVGVRLSDDGSDPEIQMIDKTSMKSYFNSIEAAAKAKKDRLDAVGRTQQPSMAVPMMGGRGSSGNPIADIDDPTELIKLGLKQRR
jgi:hypothetical protein